MLPKRHSLTLLFTLRSFIFDYKIAISQIQHLESYPLPAKGGTPPILRGDRHADCIPIDFPNLFAQRLIQLSCFNGIMNLNSPLKIGGVPQSGEGV